MSRRELGLSNQKKTKDDKIKQGAEIRANLEKYERIYVLNFSSSKSEPQNDIRRKFRSSTLCLAKRTVITHAIGLTEEEEVKPGMSGLIQYLGGNNGLFMTNESQDDVTNFLETLTCPEYATAGFQCTYSYTVPAGPLPQFPYSMDGYLRELGLPVQLENGVIVNVRDYTVCEEGQTLTKNQASLLKHFEVKMDTYSVRPVAVWENGSVTAF